MLKISYDTRDNNCRTIKIYCLEQKFLNKKFRVIDVGGDRAGWTSIFADMIVDFNSPISSKTMSLDICEEDSWQQLISHVNTTGMYDYAICTHTLEDVYNPFLALKYLPKIAHCGVFTMPSINTELCRGKVENEGWIGYIHHRWIFDSIDGKMFIIPKLTVLEAISNEADVKYDKSREEIKFDWDKEIPYEIFMNNFLGPDTGTVIEALRQLIKDRI